MKYRELWENIVGYPDKLIYYDCETNEEDKITNHDEMDVFSSENADRELVDNFFIDLGDKTLYVEFEKEKRYDYS